MDRKRPHDYDDGEGRHKRPDRGDRRSDDTSPRDNTGSPRDGSSNGRSGIQSRLIQRAAESSQNFDINAPSEPREERRQGGKRAFRPRPTDAQLTDFVITRDKDKPKTVAPNDSNSIALTANFYRLKQRPNRNLYRYHVDFDPVIERTYEKRILFEPHAHNFTWQVFDGSALFTVAEIPADKLIFYSTKQGSDEKIAILIKPDPVIIGVLDPQNIQIYNILLRKCLRGLKLREMGRYYYDDAREAAFIDAQARLEVWPGYKTSFRQHETSLLLNVDMTNKVLHQETILHHIKNQKSRKSDDEIKDELVNLIVMTTYNARPYKVDDVAWDQSPATTFDYKGQQVSYADYISEKYGIHVREMNQPILYSRPKRKDIRRGMREPIALIPELCRRTGLTDSHRADYRLMKRLSIRLQLNPDDRVKKIKEFAVKMEQSRVNENILKPADLMLNNTLVTLTGRQLPVEVIRFKDTSNCEVPRENLDWTKELLRSPMRVTVDLLEWATVTDDDAGVGTFVDMIREKGKSMHFRINTPIITKVVQRGRNSIASYLETIDEIMAEEKNIQMIMCILSTSSDSLYGAIKRKCYMEYGVASQCLTIKKMRDTQKQGGVASKLAIQMNTKLGGVPWEVVIPLKNLMVVGYNISTIGSVNRPTGGCSIGALVATTNDAQSQFYSVLVEQERGGQTLSALFGEKMTLILDAYQRKNDGRLPTRILFYRDGVGEGQLHSVVETEVAAIQTTIHSKYDELPLPAFGFIVVNKRTSTKFFTSEQRYGRSYGNPLPGTVVDDVVTLPERYDFYLISQKGTGQGTVSPTSYNVIHDQTNLPPDRLQLLTNKLTQLYYNWSSPLAIPAVCQYASRLAFLQNLMNKSSGNMDLKPPPQLASTLYYL